MTEVARRPRAADVARDPKAAGSGRYPAIAILLHWLIAAAIVLQIVLAGRMEGPRTPTSFAVTQLHKSIGVTILLLSLARLAWRLMNPPAPLPDTMARWERELARITHIGFYVIMIGMPLTGWIMVSASKITLPTLLYGVIPWPNIPGLASLAPQAKDVWHAIGENGHGILAKLIYVLLALHVAGALKHQLLSRDEPVLARMAPGAVAGRWKEPRILAIILGAVAVIAFGKLFTPPLPKMGAPPAAVTPLSSEQEPVEAQGPSEPATQDTAPSPNLSGPTPGQAPPAGNAAVAPAAAPGADAAPAKAAEPVRWAIAPGSTLGFTASWSGNAIDGRFDRWQGDIRFSPDALDKSSVRITVDVSSANTGDSQRDATLPSSDWFDAQSHKNAIFTASKFTKAGADRYVAHGTLELRGVKRPVSLPFTLHINGDKAQVSGVTSVDRTAFGVGQGEWAKTDQIAGKVSVSVKLNATRS